MKIALIIKKEKPGTKETRDYLSRSTEDLQVYEGNRGDPFP
jgi:hypothetical protein